MNSHPSGTLTRTARGGYFAQFSIGGGKRKGALLTACDSEPTARRRMAAIGELVAALREAGHTGVIPDTIVEGATADAAGFEDLRKVVRSIVVGKEPGLSGPARVRREGITVAELANDWTSGKLAEQWPDHVRVKRTSKEDARLLGWLGKVRMPDGGTFGDRPVASVTLDDCDHVMAALPRSTQTSATRRHYAQALRKLLVYAVYPLRVLPALPIPKGWLPKGSTSKARSWVYPKEDVALMRCAKVPLARRLLYGFLAREGLRPREALALTWSDLDLKTGVLLLDVNKTDDPRSWALGEDVTRALDAWRKLRGRKAEKNPRVFPRSLVGNRWALAKLLREGLTLAGVTRPELTNPKAGRLRLRAHDLRGSFVTLALAAGRTEAWVTDRTGHTTSSMIYRYKRASRSAAELGLGWFAPLDEAIPELSPKGGKGGRQGANGVQTGGPRRTETSRGHSGSLENKPFATSQASPRSSLNPLADSSSLSWPTEIIGEVFGAPNETSRPVTIPALRAVLGSLPTGRPREGGGGDRSHRGCAHDVARVPVPIRVPGEVMACWTLTPASASAVLKARRKVDWKGRRRLVVERVGRVRFQAVAIRVGLVLHGRQAHDAGAKEVTAKPLGIRRAASLPEVTGARASPRGEHRPALRVPLALPPRAEERREHGGDGERLRCSRLGARNGALREVDAIDLRPVPPNEIAGAHAPFAPRDGREHAELEIGRRARDELRKLGVRQDRARLLHFARLRHADELRRVGLDELLLARGAEEALHHAPHVGHACASEALGGDFLEDAAHVVCADVGDGELSDRGQHVAIEPSAFVRDGCDALGPRAS